jgi:hypothetical protein
MIIRQPGINCCPILNDLEKIGAVVCGLHSSKSSFKTCPIGKQSSIERKHILPWCSIMKAGMRHLIPSFG